MKNKIFLLLLYILIFISCQREVKPNINTSSNIIKKEKLIPQIKCPKYILDNKKNNLNISIFIDLSDRIEYANQTKKDSAYLSSISKAFINHVRQKKLIFLNDKIQLLFNPEPTDEIINQISRDLKISINKNINREKLSNTIDTYSRLPIKLHEIAKLNAKKSKGYLGSDIWRFFKDHVTDYCIDECHRNILIILTDGYMYHKKTKMNDKNRSSYLTPKSLKNAHLNSINFKKKIKQMDLGFISATSNLNDLEVLVIGITDKNDENPYAQDIIKAYWEKWFLEMGILKFKIKSADIPSSIEKVIFNFINE